MKLPETKRKNLATYCWVHHNTVSDRKRELYEPTIEHQKKIQTYYRCQREEFDTLINKIEENKRKPHNNI